MNPEYRPSDPIGAAVSRPGRSEMSLPAWHEQAACRGKNTDLFFPPEATSDNARKPRKGDPLLPGQVICQGCSVIKECGVWAIERRLFVRDFRGDASSAEGDPP